MRGDRILLQYQKYSLKYFCFQYCAKNIYTGNNGVGIHYTTVRVSRDMPEKYFSVKLT